jgi:hypothetical protein
VSNAQACAREHGNTVAFWIGVLSWRSKHMRAPKGVSTFKCSNPDYDKAVVQDKEQRDRLAIKLHAAYLRTTANDVEVIYA